MAKLVACLGDPSDHGGTVVSTNTDNTLVAAGDPVAANGAMHSCPIQYHGTTAITAVTTRSYVNGKLVLTTDAVAGCGARLTPPARGITVE